MATEPHPAYRSSEPEILQPSGRAVDAGLHSVQADRSGHEQSHLQYCDLGYSPSGRVDLDLLRLGALCGPSNGLLRGVRSIQAVRVGEPWRLPLPELADGCARVIVALESPDELSRRHALASHPVEITIERRAQIIARCALRLSGWCPPHSLVCSESDATIKVELGPGSAPRNVGIEVWHRSAAKY